MAVVASLTLPSRFVSNKKALSPLGATSSVPGRSRVAVRASNNDLGVRDLIEKTKVQITKDDVLRNQEQNESEKRSVFGKEPSSSAPYPRPEVERRPETGDTSFGSLMAFDGAGPETINGRLAMVGFWWAIITEKVTGLRVTDQFFSPDAMGLFYFVAVAQLFFYASLVPMFRGESSDSRKFGPFTAKAERWNGRLAMLGFASLLIYEAVRGTALIHM